MSPAHLIGSPRDPRELAPVGAYMTDGNALVEIIESDWVGVRATNVVTDEPIDLERLELIQQWRRVRPAKEPPA